MSKRSPSIKDGKRRLQETDVIFRALAHQTRRHILLVLQMRGGEMSSREIAERFSCAWPTVTRHLRQLERAGLVWVERKGNERIYHLDVMRLRDGVDDWIRWFQPGEDRSKVTRQR